MNLGGNIGDFMLYMLIALEEKLSKAFVFYTIARQN